MVYSLFLLIVIYPYYTHYGMMFDGVQ